MDNHINRLTRLIASLRRPGGVCGLLLLVALGGVGLTPAQAAPQAQGGTPASMRFYMNVAQPGKFCAGQQYSILVTPRAEMEVRELSGRTTTRTSAVTGVRIKAEITDTAFATIAPGSQTTSVSETFQQQDNESGAVTFRLNAIKAG